MKKTLLFSLLFSGILFSAPVFSEVDSNPCKTDKDTFCSACKEDKTCVKECMKTNETKLSQICQAHRAEQKKSNKK